MLASIAVTDVVPSSIATVHVVAASVSFSIVEVSAVYVACVESIAIAVAQNFVACGLVILAFCTFFILLLQQDANEGNAFLGSGAPFPKPSIHKVCYK